MKTLRTLLTILAATLILSGCAPPEPVRIGFLGGLSGRVSDLGIGGLNGVRLAVELRNKTGGIKGRPIELVEADDQQDPATAVLALDRLIQHRVEAVVGPMTSAMAMAAVPRANQARLLLMSPTVTTGDLLGLDDYFFRIIPATREFVKSNADYYFQTLGLRRIRLVYDLRNKSYSESWFEEFSKSFAKNEGTTLLDPVRFTSSDETLFPELARQVLSGEPEGVIIISNSVDAAMLCQAIRKLDSKIVLGTSEWAATERLAELGGQWVEGLTVAQFFDRNSQRPTYLPFRAAYQNRFSREPGYPEAFSFDATNVILDALEQRESNQTLKQTILTRKHYQGVQHPIEFDAHGDTQGKTFMVSIQKGNFVPIKR